jgi:hypothetical protein
MFDFEPFNLLFYLFSFMSTCIMSNTLFVDTPAIYPLGDCQTELIMGGRHGRERDDSRHRSGSCGRSIGGGLSCPMTGFFGGQSSGPFSVTIYQINLALNMIMGGTGNSILNLQGNQAAQA